MHFPAALLTLGLSLLAALAAALPAGASPAVVPAAPEIGARAHILVDHHSGRVLAEGNPDEPLEPASLTKMMTAYVVFAELAQGNISLEDEVLVSEKAWRMPGSRMFVEVDTRVRVEDLLKGVIIQSGNDASVALAEYVAGTESAFAQLMNEYARRLGMASSNFVNSTGLPDEQHYTTARDMAVMASALVRDFPSLYQLHAVKEYVYNDITQHNRNRLLWRDDTVDGIKTGHTSSAGYCLVASAVRDGMRLISVVLGSQSEKKRAQQTQALLEYGFRFFETHRLYSANEALTEVRVWKGETEMVGMGLAEDLWITVPRGQYEKLKATVELDSRILAPVRRGETRGSVRIRLGEQEVAERPLVALRRVREGGLWQRLSDHVMLMFQ